MPMDEAVLDFQSLGIVETPAGPRTRVVVVAVRREMVERIVAATRDAGPDVEGIDLSAFAMVRALAPAPRASRRALRQRRRPHQRRRRLGPAASSPAPRPAAWTLWSRRSPSAGPDARARPPVAAARRPLTPLEAVEGDPELVAAARAVLEEGVHQLADTIRNSLNFYRMQENAETVDRAVLTGPASIPGFAESSRRAPAAGRAGGVEADGDDEADPAASRSPPASPSKSAPRRALTAPRPPAAAG